MKHSCMISNSLSLQANKHRQHSLYVLFLLMKHFMISNSLSWQANKHLQTMLGTLTHTSLTTHDNWVLVGSPQVQRQVAFLFFSILECLQQFHNNWGMPVWQSSSQARCAGGCQSQRYYWLQKTCRAWLFLPWDVQVLFSYTIKAKQRIKHTGNIYLFVYYSYSLESVFHICLSFYSWSSSYLASM